MAAPVNQVSELIANLLCEASDHARRIINAKAQVQRYEAGVPADIAEQKLAEYTALIKSNIARNVADLVVIEEQVSLLRRLLGTATPE